MSKERQNEKRMGSGKRERENVWVCIWGRDESRAIE